MRFMGPVIYLVSTILWLLGWAESSHAIPVTYSYTGTVGSTATGIFAGQGSQLTGTFTFDSALVDGNSNWTQDIYSASDPNNVAAGRAFELTVTLGTVTRTTANNRNAPGTDHHFLNIVDSSASGDKFQFRSSLIAPTDDFAELWLLDLVPTNSADGIAVRSSTLGSNMAATIALLDNINVGLFSNTYNSSVWEAVSKGTGAFEGSLSFGLTSINRVPTSQVPEPSSILLLCLGLIAGLFLKMWPCSD